MLRNLSDLGALLFGRLPGQLVIQITNHCNGSCPQCGMRKSAPLERRRLTAAQVLSLVGQCARNGVEAVSLTGGEPFINPTEALGLLEQAGQRGIRYLRSGTNGYMFVPGAAIPGFGDLHHFIKALAATRIRNFWISMDSADPAVHEAMRGLPGVVAGIREALPVFHAQGLYPAVNLGLNRNIAGPPIPPPAGPEDEERFFEAFKQGLEQFLDRAIAMGFTMANVCYPMSSVQAGLAEEKAVYGAISEDTTVNFSPVELRLIFKALLEVIPRFRSRIRIFTPLSALRALSLEDKTGIFPCLGGIRYFFADSKDGNLYPCGFRGGENLGSDLAASIRAGGQTQPFCKKCHWECFSDPSQLFGMARYLIRHPVRALFGKKFNGEQQGDPELLKLWREDIRYYARNDFFDGRRPMKQQAAAAEQRHNASN
jgi:MoaA/NifB/PqqE/SkfB family radical SAM enzyme